MIYALLDQLLERTVVPSFSSLGPFFRRRLFDWQPLESYRLDEQVVVLTGGTSGIGEVAAHWYAQLGATLIMVARNPEKTDRVIAELRQRSGNTNIHPVIADLGNLAETRRAAAEISDSYSHIDTLVHNAGALFNHRQHSNSGIDLTVELMVTAPFLLTSLLLPTLKPRLRNNVPGDASGNTPGRVLTMSSGGMYTANLAVDDLQMSDEAYQGAKQYARAKRAQVALNEVWADKVDANEIVFHALHPGWVDTPGINEALPRFSKILGPLGLLRKPREGADTLIWLSCDDAALQTNGKFWHDRKIRSPYMSKATRQSDTAERRTRLWQWCKQHCGITAVN